MIVKEFRIPMPLSVEEYHIGQLYMIAKHSNEQSGDGEGVEVVTNEPHEDPLHGKGQFTEKRIHLSSRLPHWIQSLIPRIFYVTEKAWNYYPRTVTEYTCFLLPRFCINIQTCYLDDAGTSHNALKLDEEQLKSREVDLVDVVADEISAKHYKPEEDLKLWRSQATGRGPLAEGWLSDATLKPMMCSYKYVTVSFEVWGLQSRVEDYVQRAVRDVLLVGHRQAVAWLDQWIHMTSDDVRRFERETFAATNEKVGAVAAAAAAAAAADAGTGASPPPDDAAPPAAERRGWFSWS